MKLLAVAESDAYVKWAAWMLATAAASPPGEAAIETELCLLDSLVAPSGRQLETALAGTALAPSDVRQHGLVGLRRRILADRPDVVLLGLTGPTIAAVTTVLAAGDTPRPVLAAGLPGVGLPVRGRALRARRSIDVFVAHSRRERQQYATGFGVVGASVRVALATLPFLSKGGKETFPPSEPPVSGAPADRPSRIGLRTNDKLAGPVRVRRGRVVFAAQPSVPLAAEDRRHLLELLAALGPPAPIVKLRQEPSERATHHEHQPYGVLLDELVAEGRVSPGAVELSARPLDEVLDTASCLVTVSSTVALEAIARGLPVLVVSDFGISTSLLNEVFAGSGLLSPLTPDAVDAAGAPRREWCVDNYFHPAEEDDWLDVVADLAAARRAGPATAPAARRSFDPVELRAAGRAAARITVAGARRTFGR